MAHFREDFGLVFFDPKHTRKYMLLVGISAGECKELFLIDLFRDFLDLLDRAGVVLLDRVADRLPVPVEHDDGRNHTGHADAGDLCKRVRIALFESFYRVNAVVPPVVGIFLRPAGFQRDEIVRCADLVENLPLGGDQNGFDRRGADVKSQNGFHDPTPLTAC